jgi:hypothetical protein
MENPTLTKATWLFETSNANLDQVWVINSLEAYPWCNEVSVIWNDEEGPDVLVTVMPQDLPDDWKEIVWDVIYPKGE